jgi:hypothetical protein
MIHPAERYPLDGMRKSPVTPKEKPLWTCPKCVARFVTRNLWHSCGRATMADWETRMNARTRALFHHLTQVIGANGTYYLAPAKTRIAIMAQVRFAGVTAMTDDSITISFALPKRVRSSRFLSVSEVAPGWFAHRIKVTDTKQFDPQVREWLAQSYRLMGNRERLSRKARKASR